MHTPEQDYMTSGFMGAMRDDIDANRIRDAAPELLEALEMCTGWFEETARHDKCGRVYYIARAAIAKARGE